MAVTISFLLVQVLNGISFGMLLFLLAAGLSLIYGVMRILNLAHGSFYLLGAYVALSIVQWTGSLALAALVGTAVVTVVGIVMERSPAMIAAVQQSLALEKVAWDTSKNMVVNTLRSNASSQVTIVSGLCD